MRNHFVGVAVVVFAVGASFTRYAAAEESAQSAKTQATYSRQANFKRGVAAFHQADYAKAFYLLSPYAKRGVAYIQVKVGWMYLNGKGTAKNAAEGIRFYKAAAAHGDDEGQFFLGMAYEDGTGVPKKPAEAARLYRLSAAQGNSDAQSALASLYYDGTGVPQDYRKAAALFRDAAAQDDPYAQYYLGKMYLEGTGVPQNKAKAVRLLKKAAVQGDTYAKDLLQQIAAKKMVH